MSNRKNKTPAHWKATNDLVTPAMLKARVERCVAAGYGKQKWVTFCEIMMDRGLKVRLYEARRTFSKYLTVTDGSRSYKVRFSNHAPIKHREDAGDCDFFVGVCNRVTTTTEQAVQAALEHFSVVQ